MKFLCITCDEALKHEETRGPDAGVMSVIFACPGCGWQMAMYTNPWETQLVRSLDVKIGGRSVPAAPMEMLRSSLAQGRPGMPLAAAASDAVTTGGDAPKCPFADVVASAYNETQDVSIAAASDAIVWTAEAEQRVAERIPSFVRAMARMGIEKYARERGYREITPQVLDEAKNIFMG
jgi:Proto-chlorophyllide reductase 57 kD subunit